MLLQHFVPHKAKAIRRSQGIDDNITDEEARRIVDNAVSVADRDLRQPTAEPPNPITIEDDGPPFIDEQETSSTTGTQPPAAGLSSAADATLTEDVMNAINEEQAHESSFR